MDHQLEATLNISHRVLSLRAQLLAAERDLIEHMGGSKSKARRVLDRVAASAPAPAPKRARKAAKKAKTSRKSAAAKPGRKPGRKPASEGPSFASIALEKIDAQPGSHEWTAKLLAKATGGEVTACSSLLARFAKENKMAKAGRGKYTRGTPSETATESVAEVPAEGEAAQ